MQQRGDVTVDLTLAVGGVEERVVVEAPPVAVQFNSAAARSSRSSRSWSIRCRSPAATRTTWRPSTRRCSISPARPSENRPYHHAYANDYDAGGGTRRANDVLLDGVPLGASFKTAYTPAMDAVEEITVSKNSVDAENGHSLGGVISLNMKSGTNSFRGSAYIYGRDPEHERDQPIRPSGASPGQDDHGAARHRAADVRRHVRRPDQEEQDLLLHVVRAVGRQAPLSIVRTVPTELERRGDFSQSVLNGRVRTIYNPFTSTRRSGAAASSGTPFAGNVIPQAMLDPVALKMLQQIPLPNLPGNVDNWQGSVAENVDYWNFSQRVDVNITDNWKVFARYGQFKANLLSAESDRRRLLPALGQQPLRHEHRRRLGVGDVEQDDAQRARQLLQHDRRVLQPVAAARRRTA